MVSQMPHALKCLKCFITFIFLNKYVFKRFCISVICWKIVARSMVNVFCFSSIHMFPFPICLKAPFWPGLLEVDKVSGVVVHSCTELYSLLRWETAGTELPLCWEELRTKTHLIVLCEVWALAVKY